MAPALEHIKKTAPKAERRQLTVMFCDLVNSTAMSEQIDPEDMREVLTTYRQTCAKAIKQFNGFVARYIGDGILIYFGYPTAQEYEAEHAVRAGLEIVQSLSRMHTPPLQVRIGIATGNVVVGDIIGEDTEEHHAVVGQTPNLASRLMDLAEPGEIVISDSTRNLLLDLFEFRDLGARSLKGFVEPVQAWQIKRESAIKSRSHAIHQRAHLTPLIARETEIDGLTRRWEQAKAGQGQIVLVSGEAGVGKSRLTRHFEDQVKKESQVTSIRNLYCSENYKNSAFHPVIMHMLDESNINDKDNEKTKLARIVDCLKTSTKDTKDNINALMDLLSIQHESDYHAKSLNPEIRKSNIFNTIEHLFCNNIKNNPKLIIIEDLHWSDPTTLELIKKIIFSRVQHINMLVLITFRDSFLPGWPEERFITNIEVNRLSSTDSVKLLKAIPQSAQLPAAIIDEIIKRSDRIPLFLEEVYKATRENIAHSAGNKQSTAARSFNVRDVPSSLAGSLMERLDRLGSVKGVAQVAAAVGHQFSREILHDVLDLEDVELGNALDQLVQSEIIYPRKLATEQAYVFKHALLQDAAYSGLLREERARLHARIARILEEKHSEIAAREPELLAQHYSKSGLSEKAIDYWQKAGERARERNANSEAIGHFTSGLDLHKTLPENAVNVEREIDLRTNLALTLTALHGGGDAKVKENYARARLLNQLDSGSAKHFTIMVGSWRNCFVSGDLSDALSLSDELLKLAAAGDNIPHLVEARRVRGMTLFYVGNFAEARNFIESAIELHDPETHRQHAMRYGLDPLVCCHAYLAYAYLFLGQSAKALRKSDEAVAAAEVLEHPYTLAFSLAFAAFVRQNLDMPNATREFANRTIQVSEENEFQFFAKQQLIVRIWADAQLHENGVSTTQMRAALEAFMATGSTIGSTRIVSLMAQTYIENGLAVEGALMLERAKQIAGRSGERFYLAEIHRLDGELRLIGESENALAESCACFHRSLNVAQAQNADLWLNRTARKISLLGQQYCPEVDTVNQLVSLCETSAEVPAASEVVKICRDLLGILAGADSLAD